MNVRSLRILHVTEAAGGGVLTVLRELAMRNSDENHRVTVIAMPPVAEPKGGANIFSELPPTWVTIHSESNRALRAIKLSLRTLLECRREAPDLIHVHSSFAGFFLRLIPHPWRSKVVYSPHGWAFENRSLSRALRWLIRCAESLLRFGTLGVIAVSESEAASLPTGPFGPKTLILRNSVEVKQQVDLDLQSRVSVVAVGRLSAQKNPLEFARLAQILGNEFELCWVGDGEAVSKDALMAAGVEVTGWLTPDEVEAKIAGCVATVSFAKWEGLPMAVLEAQALGIPAILSEISAHAEIVTSAGNGVLVRSAEEAASAIRELARSPDIWAHRSRQSRRVIEASYSLEDYGSRRDECYRTLLARQ